jgi:hypothetical protein
MRVHLGPLFFLSKIKNKTRIVGGGVQFPLCVSAGNKMQSTQTIQSDAALSVFFCFLSFSALMLPRERREILKAARAIDERSQQKKANIGAPAFCLRTQKKIIHSSARIGK